MLRLVLRAAALTGLATVAALATATPAGAHSTNAPPASDYHTDVHGVVPATTGVHAFTAPDGEQLELRVTGDVTVVVLGYQDEPYLRVDRRGVYENTKSPAVFLNRKRVPSGRPPKGPTRPPNWVRVSTGTTARWHDHRAHWMGGVTPSEVSRAPDRAHVIERWTVPIRVANAPAAIRGRIVWTPPPATGWWYALAVVIGVIVLVATRWAAKPVLGTVLLLLAAGECLHVWGSWTVSDSATIGRIGESLPSLAAILTTLLTAFWLWRRTVWAAAPGLIIAGLFATVAGGLADVSLLAHSWIPSRLDPTLARLLVAFALGAGVAVAIAGAVRLRVQPGTTSAIPDPGAGADAGETLAAGPP